MTVCIKILNTNININESSWTKYLKEVNQLINVCASVEFFGIDIRLDRTQTYCWIVTPFNEKHKNKEILYNSLKSIKGSFKQDSIFWLEGEGQFLV